MIRMRQPVLLLLCILLAACAAMKDRADILEQAQRVYEGAVRWGQMDGAYAMHRNPDGSVPVADPRLGNYKVTGYVVQSRTVAEDKNSATQVVEIKYYHVDYLREKTLTIQQQWLYDAPTRGWLLSSAPIAFE